MLELQRRRLVEQGQVYVLITGTGGISLLKMKRLETPRGDRPVTWLLSPYDPWHTGRTVIGLSLAGCWGEQVRVQVPANGSFLLIHASSKILINYRVLWPQGPCESRGEHLLLWDGCTIR
jgi:hypothetical protein